MKFDKTGNLVFLRNLILVEAIKASSFRLEETGSFVLMRERQESSCSVGTRLKIVCSYGKRQVRQASVRQA